MCEEPSSLCPWAKHLTPSHSSRIVSVISALYVTLDETAAKWLLTNLSGFRITAYGAAGGRSVQAVHKSHGVYMTGDFLLQKDELLYILVGQEGEDACPNVSNPFYQYIHVLLFKKKCKWYD